MSEEFFVQWGPDRKTAIEHRSEQRVNKRTSSESLHCQESHYMIPANVEYTCICNPQSRDSTLYQQQRQFVGIVSRNFDQDYFPGMKAATSKLRRFYVLILTSN